jgi:hypothetical protein
MGPRATLLRSSVAIEPYCHPRSSCTPVALPCQWYIYFPFSSSIFLATTIGNALSKSFSLVRFLALLPDIEVMDAAIMPSTSFSLRAPNLLWCPRTCMLMSVLLLRSSQLLNDLPSLQSTFNRLHLHACTSLTTSCALAAGGVTDHNNACFARACCSCVHSHDQRQAT